MAKQIISKEKIIRDLKNIFNIPDEQDDKSWINGCETDGGMAFNFMDLKNEKMEDKILDIIKEESENAGVRKYTCINGWGYSQFERNISDRVIKLFAIPDVSNMLNAKHIADFVTYAKKYYNPPTLKRMYKEKNRSIIISEEHLIKQFKQSYRI